MKKAIALLLCAALSAGVFGGCCAQSKDLPQPPQLQVETGGRQVSYTFAGDCDIIVRLTPEDARTVLDAVAQQKPEYVHSDLYELEEVKKRLDFDATVKSHRYSALNAEGRLEAEHLMQLVKENNAQYLLEDDFCLEQLDDGYLLQVCDFIVEVILAMEEKYPQVDWERVYCNLGNLKIFYDVGTLNYAQVSEKWVLTLSRTNAGIVSQLKGDDGYSRVMTHEIMHLIQIGCACEQIEHCTRRCGICVYWDDFSLNTTDWGWFFEGSAERNMCNLTGKPAITYQYKMDYVCSFTMSILLRDGVQADTLETLCFYSDPELLFQAFGAQTPEQRDELLNMMITMNILQMQPTSFYERYKEVTGIDLRENQEINDQFSYTLKPAVCISLAREFYENLTLYLQENPMELNDLFFLLNLFEGHLNQHLNYGVESKAQINEPFFQSYRAMRSALFDTLQWQLPDMDVAQMYDAYEICVSEQKLNANLTDLPEQKRIFLAERAQWQAEKDGLGVKVK